MNLEQAEEAQRTTVETIQVQPEAKTPLEAQNALRVCIRPLQRKFLLKICLLYGISFVSFVGIYYILSYLITHHLYYWWMQYASLIPVPFFLLALYKQSMRFHQESYDVAKEIGYFESMAVASEWRLIQDAQLALLGAVPRRLHHAVMKNRLVKFDLDLFTRIMLRSKSNEGSLILFSAIQSAYISGDIRAIPRLQKLVDTHQTGGMDDPIYKAASDCIAHLEELKLMNHDTGTLLRPSSQATPTNELLRPATGKKDESDSSELLRPPVDHKQ